MAAPVSFNNYGTTTSRTTASYVQQQAPNLGPDVDKLRVQQSLWTRNALTWIGASILSLAVVMPIWDSLRLAHDAAYVFFLGRYWAICTIVLCIGVVLWYVVAMRTSFKYAWEGYKTEQTVLMIAMVATTVLGLGLLMISVPLRREIADTRNDLYSNCQFGSRTQRLYEYSTVLQGIRGTPACMIKESVTDCLGYQEALPYTGFLLNLETKYHCAGFCWEAEAYQAASKIAAQITGAPPASIVAGAAPPPAPDAGRSFVSVGGPRPAENVTQTLLGAIRQISEDIAKRKEAEAQAAAPISMMVHGKSYKALLATSASASKDKALAELGPSRIAERMRDAERMHNATATPGRVGIQPPTLFSKANYPTSCDGVVARDLKFKALGIGYSFYLHGATLLLSTCVIGFLRIMMLCSGSKMFPYQEFPAGAHTSTQLVL